MFHPVLSTPPTNYVYLLHEREFINIGAHVYKIGMTRRENYARLQQYPKGTRLLFQIICSDCRGIEAQLIRLFKTTFIHRADIGTEYFEGDYMRMINHMYAAVLAEHTGAVIDGVIAEHNPNESEEVVAERHARNVDAEATIAETEATCAERYAQIAERNIRTMDAVEKKRIASEKKILAAKRIAIALERKQIAAAKKENAQRDRDACVYYVNAAITDGIKIMLTNKRGAGYYKFPNGIWRTLADHTHKDFGTPHIEDLMSLPWFEDKVDEHPIEDAVLLTHLVDIYFTPNPAFYTLQYHEHLVYHSSSSREMGSLECMVFNSRTGIFTPIDVFESMHGNVLSGWRFASFNTSDWASINIDIVDTIMLALESNTKPIILQFKALLYNIFVGETETPSVTTFVDPGCLMTEWAQDLMIWMTPSTDYCMYVSSVDYYANKRDFMRTIKTKIPPRCVIITECKMASIDNQIDTFRALGFKNIIVKTKRLHSNEVQSSETAFVKYLHQHEDLILPYIARADTNAGVKYWRQENWCPDSIFSNSAFLKRNMLKWACDKSQCVH